MNKEVLLKELGDKIRLIRKDKGITQVQLAHSIGKDQQSIQRLEAGNINPTYIYLQEIAEGLNVPLLISCLQKPNLNFIFRDNFFDYLIVIKLCCI
jgi:putative transcriptional regulator